VTAAVALAGCSGDGSNGSDGSGDTETDESTATGTDGTTETDSGAATTARTEEPTDAATATPTNTETATPTDSGGTGDYPRDPDGSIAGNAIDELEVVGWDRVPDGDTFRVRVWTRNVGDQQTNASEYTHSIGAYDADGNQYEDSGFNESYPENNTNMPPGEVGSVTVQPYIGATNDEVATYEVTLDCSGDFADGVYCPE